MPSTQGRQVMDTESTRKQFIYTWTSILFALLKRQIWSEAPPPTQEMYFLDLS